MIIWISGAYGVGKSTLAEAIAGITTLPGIHIATTDISIENLVQHVFTRFGIQSTRSI